MPFYVMQDVGTMVSNNFYLQSYLLTDQTFTIGNGGLNFTFNITDNYNNPINTVLLNREQP